VKIIEVNENSSKVQLWDTTGKEKYRSITKHHYKWVVEAFIFYDVTTDSSYNLLQKRMDEIKMYDDVIFW
jgi:GTPase SAR1 family protein